MGSLSLNRPSEVLNEKLKTMILFNDTVNGVKGYIPPEYHVSFLKKLDKNIIKDDELKGKLLENINNYQDYTARKFANLMV